MSPVTIPAVGTGTSTPIVSTDNVTADSSQVQNVQLTSVAAGVLTRLGTAGSPLEVAIVGTVPISGAPTTVTANLGTLNGAGLDTSLQSILTQLNTNTTNINQFRIGGQSVNLGTGTVGTGTQRVVLATDQAQLTNALKVDASATTQPISAAALPLPSGAATQTTLASLLAKTPAIGTAGTPAADVISVQGVSGGTAIPVTGSFAGTTDLTGSGSITGSAQSVSITSMNGMATATVQITGTFSGIMDFQATIDGTNWFFIATGVNIVNGGIVTNSQVSTVGKWVIPVGGYSGFRLLSEGGWASGTAVINIRATASPAYFGLSTSLPTGGNTIGKVGIDQTTPGTTNLVAANNTQINGAALAANAGSVSSGTQRVVEAASVTPTQTSVAASGTTVSLLASNTSRMGATFYNEPGGAILFLKLGATASTTSYTIQIAAGGYYELPYKYNGAIDGIWATASGNVRITELV